MRRLALVLGMVGAIVLLPAVAAGAHPLGNFTVNQYVGVRVGADRVTVDYVVDKAEIPTFQDADGYDSDRSGQVSAAEADAWQRAQCAAFRENLAVRVDGRVVSLAGRGGAAAFPEGQAGLPTERVECRYEARAAGGTVEVDNANFADRIGWREMTAVGDGTTVAGDVAAVSPSARLTAYPQDRLQSPPDQRSVRLGVTPGGPAGPPLEPLGAPDQARSLPKGVAPRGVDGLSRRFTGFIDHRELTLWFACAAVGASIVLGALHALAPGHGKTVMAAYLVGQKGTPHQAVIVGSAVTVTHTAGVLILSLAISSSTLVAPDRLYPWLGLTSGLMLAWIGLTILRRVIRARRGRMLPIDVALTTLRHQVAGALPAAPPAPGAHPHDHVHAAHAHAHDDSHDHEHGHDHGPDHSHDHDHDPGHDHSHGHDHGHDHGHELVPVGVGGREHGPALDAHARAHAHGHAHPHDHRHDHGPAGPGHPDHGHERADNGHGHVDHGPDHHGHADHGHTDHGHVDHGHEHSNHGPDHHGHVDHGHAHNGHDHGHADAVGVLHSHGMGHSHRHVALDPEQPFTLGTLVAMGLAGGMVPSPSALVVLLGAIALGRVWFGVLLVFAYGVGMAVTLTTAGLVLLRARTAIEKRVAAQREPRRLLALGRMLPLVSSMTITLVGLVLALRALRQL